MKKYSRFWMLVLTLTLVLGACTPATPAATPTPANTPTLVAANTPAPTPTSEPPRPMVVGAIQGLPQGTDGYSWWNDTNFYEIFVRSFYDSNGDGIGDFNGITQKLDYLQDLGITGVWLMPIFPSPSYHGYDVTDYYNVNSDYGTMEDFKNLLSAAHQHGIRIIIDMVLNHTSSQNPWFQEALDPASPKRNWYVWSETNPGGVGPWGEKVWYSSPNGNGFYYAVFWDQMPDLNLNTPEVRQEAEKILAFWAKDVGVDGFRFDGARYLVEDGKVLADSPGNHQLLKEFRTAYKAANPQVFTVGEIWVDNFTVSTYLKSGDEFDSAFNFDLASGIIKGVNERKATSIRDQLKFSVKLFPKLSASNFITNHDMPRVLNQLIGVNNEEKGKLAASILMTAPGIPFVYYGEEIGMSGKKPDELIRTPMQWLADKNAGFTAGTPWEAVNKDADKKNVAAEAKDPDSLLTHYRSLLRLRNEHAALRVGDWTLVDSKNQAVLAYLRISKEETLLVVINLSKDPVNDYTLSLAKGSLTGSYLAVSLLGDDELTPPVVNAAGGLDPYLPLPEIPANGTLIIQLQSAK